LQKTGSDRGKPYTVEEARLIVDLRENKKLPWYEVEKHTPGRTYGAMAVAYGRLKSMVEEFSLEEVIPLCPFIRPSEVDQ
jgi:hypothetical protein